MHPAEGAASDLSLFERPAPGGESLLLIEDDAEAAAYLAGRLAAAGWRVDCADDGEAGLAAARAGRFDVLLVDRMLPSRDGLSLVEELRRGGVDTPVMFVTALGGVGDRIAGFHGGGDDYLVKPFAFEELDARLHALARRGRSKGGGERVVLRIRDLEINRIDRTVHRAGAAIDLLPLEYKLLEFLALRAGQVVTRKMLLEGVWGFQFDPQTNIVESHLSRLRAKLDGAATQSPGVQPPADRPFIVTIRGAGYVLADR